MYKKHKSHHLESMFVCCEGLQLILRQQKQNNSYFYLIISSKNVIIVIDIILYYYYLFQITLDLLLRTRLQMSKVALLFKQYV